MADITLTIPNASLTRIIDGICNAYNYDLAIEGVSNPPTKGQFAKAKIIEFVKTTVKNEEISAAQQAITSDAEAINIT